MPDLSRTAARIRPAVFSDLQARIDRLAGEGKELVPLHIGDTHLPPPEAARRTVDALRGDDEALFRYGLTAGTAELRTALAARLSRGSRAVDPTTEILLGNGGTHALFCAARSVLDEGDEVVLATPYWPLAPGVFTSAGATLVEAPLSQELYADPSADAGALLAARVGPKTRALYIISPNNPDGKVLTKAQLASIAELARGKDLWVFSDEVYADAVYDGEHLSIADLPGMRERTIVLHSLSKSHALAGCRVGFAVAPPAVVAAARRVSTHSAFNVAAAMQRTALAALSDPDFTASSRAVYREARDATAAALRGAPVHFHVAEGASYLFVDFAPAFDGAPLDAAARDKPLLALLERAVDRGVLLAPGGAFGAAYGTFARLCFTSVPTSRVVAGVARLREAIDALRRGEP